MGDALKKIVITGPESSGKSVLCKGLALHFNKTYTTEFARDYLEKKGSAKYSFDDFEEIYKGHIESQREAIATASGFIFLDTDMVNFYVWAKKVFGMIPDWIDESLKEESDHRYLIASPDIPWEADTLRKNPQNRLDIFEEHRALITSLKRPYHIIKGVEKTTRLNNAIQAVESLLK